MPLDLTPFDNINCVDLDFTTDPHWVFGDTGINCFGNLCRSYGDVVTEIDESLWPSLVDEMEHTDTGLEWLVKWILNQMREGSCVGNASAQQGNVLQAKQFGLDLAVALSAISMYDRIGSSPNSGASISDALDEGRARGFVPLSSPENIAARNADGSVRFPITMPATGFSRRMPTGWETVAKHFRIDEYFICRSVEQMISALLNGHPTVVGRAGHSILYLRPVYKNGRLYVLYVNSWEDWGAPAGTHKFGFGLDSLSYIRSSASWCYAARTITVPPWAALAA